MDYRSTDYRGGGTTACADFLRAILDSPRLVVIPDHEANTMPMPLLIIKAEGRVALFVVSYQDNFVYDLNSTKWTMMIEPQGLDDRYIFEYDEPDQRNNVFNAIATAWMRDISRVAPRIT